MMVVAFLVTLAILTYDPADNLLARRFSLDAILSPGNIRAANALGLLGAAIARFLVPHFLGYTVVLIPIAFFGWGYVWLRNRPRKYVHLVTILFSVTALFSASLIGWFSLVSEQDMLVWSGIWGLGVAGWLQQITGTAGSFILLIFFLLVTFLLLIDHDVQRSMDRVENLFRGVRDGSVAWWSDRSRRKMERSERNEERKLRKKKSQEAARSSQKRADKVQSPPRGRNIQTRETPSDSPASVGPGIPNGLSRSTGSGRTDDNPAPPAAHSDTDTDVAMQVHAPIQEEKTDVLQRTADGSDFLFRMPDLDLLDDDTENQIPIDYEELEEKKAILLDKLATYNIEITSIEAIVGPTVTLYELTPAPGIKISRITALENDLAMAMAAKGIRMIAPIPGKSAIGVEIPNRHRELVRIRDIIGTTRFSETQMELPLILGKSIEGEIVLQDLTKMPHVLIAGATGSGKSVGLNTFIAGLLYACQPHELKFVMIDPKKIELASYGRIVKHYIAMSPYANHTIITDVDQALGTLQSCEKEMERRYDILSKAQVRSLKEYNDAVHSNRLTEEDGHQQLPYIVVVVDELADLMMTAGKEIEAPIARLAQMSRAVGIHLILATQRPSVDVITGLIKANFPSRIAYQVASKIDSRTILDQNGAEGLVGNGDLLYMLGSRIIRLQGPFVSIEEVDNLTRYIGDQPGVGAYELPEIDRPDVTSAAIANSPSARDELFGEAAHIIVRAQQGSVSLLQRKLSVGYARAARLVDQLEDAGIVGPFEGSKARKVLVEDENQLDKHLAGDPE